MKLENQDAAECAKDAAECVKDAADSVQNMCRMLQNAPPYVSDHCADSLMTIAQIH
jgi:hypothetical protein